MSKNNTIRRSDKKFIRLEKARIRRQFFDGAKQQELINELYKRFMTQPVAVEQTPAVAEKSVTVAKKIKKGENDNKNTIKKSATVKTQKVKAK